MPLRNWLVRLLLPFAAIALAVSVSVVFELDQIATMLVTYALVLIQLMATERLRPGGSFVTSGLTLTPSFPRMALIGIGYGTVLLGLVLATALALGASVTFTGLVPFGGGLVLLAFSSAGEEFLFRGTMFEAIRERFGEYTAVGITSVLFGLAHIGNAGIMGLAMVNVVLASLLLGTLTAKTNSLWPAVLFHITWNILQQMFIGNVSGGNSSGWVTTMHTDTMHQNIVWLVSGRFGIEQGLCTTFVLAVAIVAVVVLGRPDGTVKNARLRRDLRNE